MMLSRRRDAPGVRLIAVTLRPDAPNHLMNEEWRLINHVDS
jgi:hypothetical protein